MGIMEIVASVSAEVSAETTEYKRKSVKQFISHNNSS